MEAADAKEARRRLTDTLAMTRKHFEKEEEIIFAIADRELSEGLQHDLGAKWAASRNMFVASTPCCA
jgi:hemerythrin-like domain-containing protein